MVAVNALRGGRLRLDGKLAVAVSMQLDGNLEMNGGGFLRLPVQAQARERGGNAADRARRSVRRPAPAGSRAIPSQTSDSAEGALPTAQGVVRVRHEKRPDGSIDTKIDAPPGVRVVR